MLKGRLILVTGATGRLGTELSRRVEELGGDVFPVIFGGYPDRPRRMAWQARTTPIRLITPDDAEGMPDPDHVINCHWEVDRGASFAGQLALEIDRNLRAPEFFWDRLARSGLRSFVNVSSIRIFGPLSPQPISSTTPPRPNSPYGIAKVAAESYFDARFRAAGVPVAHMRLCSLMAAGGHPTQLTSQILSGLTEGRKIRINRGHQTHLLHIDEAADILLQAAVEERDGRFNIVAEGIANEAVAELFSRISGRELRAEFADLQPGVPDPVFVPEAAVFGAAWVRRTPIEDAIRKTVGV
jgi:UDP-glucose 4-epimerase